MTKEAKEPELSLRKCRTQEFLLDAHLLMFLLPQWQHLPVSRGQVEAQLSLL